MRTLKPVLFAVVFLALLLLPLAAFAQNTVKADQGKPGTQGPWPVTLSSPAGSVPGSAVRPVQCQAGSSQHTTISLSTSATAITPSLTTRAYAVVCVSVETSGTPVVRCRADGTNPTNVAGSTGDTLTTGDCLVYPVVGNGGTDPIRCIASAAAYVTVFQCVP